MGRHKNVDCFDPCQLYTAVPKHLVRDNVNLLIPFHHDEVNLKHFHDDHVNTDKSYNQFKNLCSKCWVDSKHCFIVIDKDTRRENVRVHATGLVQSSARRAIDGCILY